MQDTKWIAVWVPSEVHELLQTEAHLQSIEKKQRVTLADVARDAFDMKANSIKSKRRLW